MSCLLLAVAIESVQKALDHIRSLDETVHSARSAVVVIAARRLMDELIALAEEMNA